MLLALLGLGVASAFGLLFTIIQNVLPPDAWNSAIAIGTPLAFLVPPTFAASVPLAITAMLAIGGTRMILNLVGRK